MKRHLGSLGSINLVWGLIFLIFVDMKRGFGYKGGGGGGGERVHIPQNISCPPPTVLVYFCIKTLGGQKYEAKIVASANRFF